MLTPASTSSPPSCGTARTTRAAGLSWTQIGHQFGTSKQAAQKRYGAGATEAWPGRWTPAARRALARAEEEARGLGRPYVGTEHETAF